MPGLFLLRADLPTTTTPGALPWSNDRPVPSCADYPGSHPWNNEQDGVEVLAITPNTRSEITRIWHIFWNKF